MRKEIKNHWHTWIFLLSLGIALIIVFKALDSIGYIGMCIRNLIKVVWPFLVGLLIAYLLYIPERKIENSFKKSKRKIFRKNARKWGILWTYVIALLILLITINVIMPVLVESIDEFISNVQSYYAKIIDTYNNLPNDSVFKTEQVYSALKELQNFDIKQYVSIDRITGYVKSVVGLATGVFDAFVAIVVSVYILSQRNEILAFFKKLSACIFKEKTYRYIENIFDKSNEVFFKFISGQLVDALIVGILATVAMYIMKVKYALLLGFTIGLFNIIPYFGAIIAVAIAAVITLITAGFSKALLLLVVVIILQQIDANVINPKIIGDSLKISPLLVILAVTIGGAYFGVIGMFLGVPVAAVLKILVNDYIDNKLSL